MPGSVKKFNRNPVMEGPMLILKNAQQKLTNLLFLVSLMAMLTSCFSGITPPEARIALNPVGTATATFKRGPLSVDYRHKFQQNTLQISGEIHFQYAVDELNVRIEFLDQEGAVLSRHIVYSSGYRTSVMEKSGRFDTEVKIPNGAVAFTFSSSEKQSASKK
jgi:hypothetical protein